MRTLWNVAGGAVPSPLCLGTPGPDRAPYLFTPLMALVATVNHEARATVGVLPQRNSSSDVGGRPEAYRSVHIVSNGNDEQG